MSIWYAIPCAKRPDEWSTLPLWRLRGYKIALFRDEGAGAHPLADLNIFGKYEGYPRAVNQLCREILQREPDTQWIVTGGDDIAPDPRVPRDAIAEKCLKHFGGTFGVMQPTGDQYMIQGGKTATERVCESPWMGVDFIKRVNGGRGPYPEEYFHFFCDEHFHCVAEKLGVLWHRPDLIHYHHHWGREGKARPEYLHPARLDWGKAQALFNERKAAGFPGHEPCEISA